MSRAACTMCTRGVWSGLYCGRRVGLALPVGTRERPTRQKCKTHFMRCGGVGQCQNKTEDLCPPTPFPRCITMPRARSCGCIHVRQQVGYVSDIQRHGTRKIRRLQTSHITSPQLRALWTEDSAPWSGKTLGLHRVLPKAPKGLFFLQMCMCVPLVVHDGAKREPTSQGVSGCPTLGSGPPDHRGRCRRRVL